MDLPGREKSAGPSGAGRASSEAWGSGWLSHHLANCNHPDPSSFSDWFSFYVSDWSAETRRPCQRWRGEVIRHAPWRDEVWDATEIGHRVHGQLRHSGVGPRAGGETPDLGDLHYSTPGREEWELGWPAHTAEGRD